RYAASSALIKQIAQGAAADVFASADSDWMDWGLNKKLIKDARVNLLGNELVLIAPSNSKLDSVAIGQNLDLAKLAGDGSIAIADVGTCLPVNTPRQHWRRSERGKPLRQNLRRHQTSAWRSNWSHVEMRPLASSTPPMPR